MKKYIIQRWHGGTCGYWANTNWAPNDREQAKKKAKVINKTTKLKVRLLEVIDIEE